MQFCRHWNVIFDFISKQPTYFPLAMHFIAITYIIVALNATTNAASATAAAAAGIDVVIPEEGMHDVSMPYHMQQQQEQQQQAQQEEHYDFRCFNNKDVAAQLHFPNAVIGLQVTQRATHQLLSRIFAIFLREILHYSNVTLRVANYLGNIDDANYEREKLSYLLQQISYQPEQPNLNMIDLELWLPSVAHNLVPPTIYEAASTLAPGRFGWFVPKIQPNLQQQLNYSIFQNNSTDIYRSFLLPLPLLKKLLDNTTAHANSFLSPLCQNLQSCVILLAEHATDTAFIKQQIIDTDSYVNVLWLGAQFQAKVQFLINYYQTHNLKQQFIVLHWTPSALINAVYDFYNISMPQCEQLTVLQHNFCKYEQTAILKYYFKRLDSEHNEQLLVALRRFKLKPNTLKQLLQDLTSKRQHIAQNSKNLTDLYNELACSWLKNNSGIYKNWLTNVASTPTLYIGGILPMSINAQQHYAVVYAVRQAVHHINSNMSILNKFKLEVFEIDGKCEPDIVLRAFLHYFDQPQLLGVLGPACADTLLPVAGISRHTHMPLITYAATAGNFDKRQEYPYVFRTIGSDQQMQQALLSLLRYYNWQRVAVLITEEHNYVEELQLARYNIRLIAQHKLSKDVNLADIRSHLLQLKQKHAKIIIADLNSHNAQLTFCEAYKLKLTSQYGFVWILPSKVSFDWRPRSVQDVNCTALELQHAFMNQLILKHRPFGDAESIMQHNVSIADWLHRFSKFYGNFTMLSDYMGFAYDAVWTFAFAAHKLFEENPQAFRSLRTEAVAKRFVQLLWESNFQGLSGHVQFESSGSRATEIIIMRIEQANLIQVGKYVRNKSLYGHLEINAWSQNAPDDGRYDCNLSLLVELFRVDCAHEDLLLSILLSLCFIICAFLVSYSFWKRRYNKKLKRSAKIMRNFGIDLLPPKVDKNSLDKWEIPKNNLILNRRLGEGAFGTVFGGEARINSEKWTAVAVKSLKTGASFEARVDFLAEAEAMKCFDHNNIIKLLGVCLQSEPIYTIMEFMLYGDLKTFLLARRHLINEKIAEDSDISPKRLSMYALDVAKGLSYLAEKRFVHRDIACRNCLVNGERTVKIGDFGMARSTYESDYYRFNRKSMLPVRWMAPEAIAQGLFTPASDVWSFGVVLYEIITFGAFPYQGLTNGQVLEYVKCGNTMKLPSGIKLQLEQLLKACWHKDQKERPQAADIVAYISQHQRLLTPCEDFPGASLEFSEAESSELELELELLSKMYNNPPSSTENNYDLDENQTNYITAAARQRIEQLLSEIDMRKYTVMDIPREYSNSVSSSTNTPTTPDGYSIMSPLLTTSRSNSTDSYYVPAISNQGLSVSTP